MGGYGSTRWDWHTPKKTVEQCLMLPIAEIKPQMLRPGRYEGGRLEWTNKHTGKRIAGVRLCLRLDADGGQVEISYTASSGAQDKRAITDVIRLSTSSLANGGRRWYGHCPRCDRRVLKLYKPPASAHFRCRQCHDLAYQSQQQHDKTAARLLRMFDGDISALLAATLARQTNIGPALRAVDLWERRIKRWLD